MIQEATLIEAILSIRTQIDFLWQFFVTVHIAILALLFIYDEAVESLNVIMAFSVILLALVSREFIQTRRKRQQSTVR